MKSSKLFNGAARRIEVQTDVREECDRAMESENAVRVRRRLWKAREYENLFRLPHSTPRNAAIEVEDYSDQRADHYWREIKRNLSITEADLIKDGWVRGATERDVIDVPNSVFDGCIWGEASSWTHPLQPGVVILTGWKNSALGERRWEFCRAVAA